MSLQDLKLKALEAELATTGSINDLEHQFWSSVAGTASSAIYGGYTPSITETTNIGTTSAISADYYRVGNKVFVIGTINGTPAGAGLVVFKLSLPITSAMTATTDLAGIVSGTTSAGALAINGYAQADATNDVAHCFARASGAGASIFSFSFSYTVI